MRRLEDLDVWSFSMDLAERVYRFTARYPASEARRLTDQTCRAALSIPANIGEGWGRGTPGEFRYFLRVASGSDAELETHLLLGVRLGYATTAEVQPLLNEVRRIRRMLDALARTLAPSSRSAQRRMPHAETAAPRIPRPNASRKGSAPR